MAVTRAQFIARAPGKKLTGIDPTLVQTMLDACLAECSSTTLGAQQDEAIHWLCGYKLAHYTETADEFRKACLAEYKRIVSTVCVGPRVF